MELYTAFMLVKKIDLYFVDKLHYMCVLCLEYLKKFLFLHIKWDF